MYSSTWLDAQIKESCEDPPYPFLVAEVEYFGKVISKGQVRPSPRKFEALVNTSPPENVKQVRQLLGLAEVHTDASSVGYGAVLLQIHPNDKVLTPIEQAQKQLSIEETLQKDKKFDKINPKSVMIDKLIGEMIAVQDLSFHSVEVAFLDLCELLRQHTSLKSTQRTSLEAKVLCALLFYAKGGYQCTIGEANHCSQETMSVYILTK
ncbi:unnamed protein product [Colias eurytheme]|nr:unnamed protein product [Colias eurytheme]